MLLLIPSDFPLFSYTMTKAPEAIPNMDKEQTMNMSYCELRRDFKGKCISGSKKKIGEE
jgi:hypothetical protein